MVAVSQTLSRLDSRHAIEGGEEVGPGLTLLGQDFSTRGSQFVIPPAALPGFFNPAALNPPASLQAIEQGVQRGYMKLQDALPPLLDELGEWVAASGAFFDEREDQHFGACWFNFLVWHRGSLFLASPLI